MIDSRYEWKKRPQTDQDQTKKLAEALNLSELVAEILINRGYDTKEKAENFLKPGPENPALVFHSLFSLAKSGCDL